MSGTAVCSGAWGEVVSHDARFEFPDVITFADGGQDGSNWRGGPWAAEGRLHRDAFVAKRAGAFRRLAVLDPAVHARYRTVVAGVAGAVERSLGHEVGGGRCLAVGPRLVMEPWRRAWRRHERRLRGLGSRSGLLVRVDVRNCFGSILPDAVAAALDGCEADRGAAAAVQGLLVRFDEDGVSGLPVGPEPSAVLANAVLGLADRSLRSEGFAFARWCDDVVMRVPGGDVRAAEDAWTAALAPLGLLPAPEKTRVFEAGERIAVSGPEGAESGGSPRSSLAGAAVSRTPHARDPRNISRLCDLAVHATQGPDPHLARSAVARVGFAGGRRARLALRHVRRRAPHLAPTADWGLRN
ncbi:MAG TPA: hypothetical protein VNN79_11880 [Actinomycetota bacterium]|nr:hypothetical protein [Actinomycetota bacterium]